MAHCGPGTDEFAQAAYVAWLAAHDLWQGREAAVLEAIRAGARGRDIKQLIADADLLCQVARELFDVYVAVAGGRVGSTRTGAIPSVPV